MSTGLSWVHLFAMTSLILLCLSTWSFVHPDHLILAKRGPKLCTRNNAIAILRFIFSWIPTVVTLVFAYLKETGNIIMPYYLLFVLYFPCFFVLLHFSMKEGYLKLSTPKEKKEEKWDNRIIAIFSLNSLLLTIALKLDAIIPIWQLALMPAFMYSFFIIVIQISKACQLEGHESDPFEGINAFWNMTLCIIMYIGLNEHISKNATCLVAGNIYPISSLLDTINKYRLHRNGVTRLTANTRNIR